MSSESYKSPSEESWRKDALCRGTDPDFFFPKETRGEEVEAAKKICGMCAVQAVCLDYALTNREEHGVWGGASEDERRFLLRARARRASM